jgi:hypothetical protein
MAPYGTDTRQSIRETFVPSEPSAALDRHMRADLRHPMDTRRYRPTPASSALRAYYVASCQLPRVDSHRQADDAIGLLRLAPPVALAHSHFYQPLGPLIPLRIRDDDTQGKAVQAR